MANVSLTELREQLNLASGVKNREYFFLSHFKQGIPKSAIIELTGSAKTTFVASLLREHPEVNVLWLGESALEFPTALKQLGVNLKKITFLRPTDFKFESIRLAARSKTTSIIIAPSVFDENILKKLKLLVEDSKSSLILLSKSFNSAYAITAQLEVNHSNETESDLMIKVLKYKCEGLPCE